MKEFRIILEEREIDDDLEPISRKTVANQYMSSPIEDDEYYEYAIKQMCQDTIDKFIERKDEMPSVPVKSIKDHDREKDKRIKELEQKVQELQEVDNKRAFRLYSVLYDVLERQDPENVASRIDFMTSKNYADICEMYKTAKNLKQHDQALVKEVCEKIRIKVDNISMHTATKERLMLMCEEIKKEFKDGE